MQGIANDILIIILFLLLVISIVSFTIIEKKMYKTYLSPFNLFAVPYMFIIPYQILATNIYDMQNITAPYLFYILIYLISFFFVGTLSLNFFKLYLSGDKKSIPSTRSTLARQYFAFNKERSFFILEYLFIILSTYLISKFILDALAAPNIFYIVQEEFQEEYSSGLGFFFRLMCMIGSAYFWGQATMKRKKYFLLGLYCFIPNFLTFVKGVIFLIILSGIISNALINKSKIKITHLFQAGIIGIAIFFLVYLIETSIYNIRLLFSAETYENIYFKLQTYILSGVQSFNVNISNFPYKYYDLDNVVYAPLMNLLAKFGLADRIDTITKITVNIGAITEQGSSDVNTLTHVGTLVLYCGPLLGMIINCCIAVIMYYFFWKAQDGYAQLYKIRYSLLVTGLVLSWFEYYYMHTFWFYLIAYFFVIDFLARCFRSVARTGA